MRREDFPVERGMYPEERPVERDQAGDPRKDAERFQGNRRPRMGPRRGAWGDWGAGVVIALGKILARRCGLGFVAEDAGRGLAGAGGVAGACGLFAGGAGGAEMGVAEEIGGVGQVVGDPGDA